MSRLVAEVVKQDEGGIVSDELYKVAECPECGGDVIEGYELYCPKCGAEQGDWDER